MTERQQTGVWFVITGILLLSFKLLAFALTDWAILSGFLSLPEEVFTTDQRYTLGGASVVSLQLISLAGIPFLLTGLAQIVIGRKK